MKSRSYRIISQLWIAALMIFAPLANGSVELWSRTVVEIMVFILVFIWLWKINNSKIAIDTENKESNFRRTKIDAHIWFFVILAVVSSVFSIYKYASLREMSRLIVIVGIYYLAVNNFDRRVVVRFASLIIIIATALSIFGLGQYFLGLNHSWWAHEEFLSATYVNHNHFAGYLELAIPLALGMFLGIKRENVSSGFKFLVYKIVLIAALLITGVAFIVAQSRGAWICLLIALIIMNIALIKKKVLGKVSLAIFLFFIILGIVYFFSGDDPVAARLQTIETINQESFLMGRNKIWTGSLNIIKKNPLIGTGIGTFVWAMPAYRPEGLFVRAHYAHNDYLHMMAEMGVLALPLMIWIICTVIAAGFRGQDRKREGKGEGMGLIDGILLGCAVGILSLSLHGLVDFNFHITANILLVGCFAGLIMRRAVDR
ncbi:O-antigen ligase family protein [Candidatus Omnitrophota bacterium]